MEKLIDAAKTPAKLDPEEDIGNWRLPFDRYHGLNEIYAYLDYLASTYPEDVFVETIGKTYEGRDIKMVKICKGGCGYRYEFMKKIRKRLFYLLSLKQTCLLCGCWNPREGMDRPRLRLLPHLPPGGGRRRQRHGGGLHDDQEL